MRGFFGVEISMSVAVLDPAAASHFSIYDKILQLSSMTTLQSKRSTRLGMLPEYECLCAHTRLRPLLGGSP